jgi:hypothetical protein
LSAIFSALTCEFLGNQEGDGGAGPGGDLIDRCSMLFPAGRRVRRGTNGTNN